MAKRVQTDKTKKMSGLKIYRKYTDCRLMFSDDLCPIDGKAARSGRYGKCGNALSENQADAWAAKNVIERIEVLRVMAAPFFAY